MDVQAEILKLKQLVYSNNNELEAESEFEQSVLWSGASMMTADQTATLNANVSDQQNGIVLIFSGYTQEDSTVQDYQYQSFFIPKKQVRVHEGRGMTFALFGAGLAPMATKYLYIYDDRIVGHASNDKAGTSSYGASYANHRFVLRHIIGV